MRSAILRSRSWLREKHSPGRKIHGGFPDSNLRAVHGRRSADHALRLQFVDVPVSEPQLGKQLAVVLPEQRCGLQMNPAGSAGGRERQGAVRCAGVYRMVDVLEETAGGKLRQPGLTVGLHDLGGRNAATPQGLDNIVASAGFAPGGEVLIDQVMVAAPTAGRRQRGS